jgi:large subunit ribosomal protein L3
LREIQVESADAFDLGQEIRSDIFAVGEQVAVTGRSKGRGFAGVVKRWGFGGGRDDPWEPVSPGSRLDRLELGPFAYLEREKKLPGRMGGQKQRSGTSWSWMYDRTWM